MNVENVDTVENICYYDGSVTSKNNYRNYD